MAGRFRVTTPGGGSVSCYPIADDTYQAACSSCAFFAKGSRMQVEAQARMHLRTRWACANPSGL
jgi:hypothetical protein